MKTARWLFLTLVALASVVSAHAAEATLVRSAKSGAWSEAKTWEGGRLPSAGAKVLVRPGHEILYDVNFPQPVRSLHIGGTLRFATDRDTRLDVGLIKIQAGEDVSEEGFDCEAHLAASALDAPRATLLVGTAEQPVDAKHTALIRLTWFEGMDKQSCPAIVDCGGRMEFHGAPMNRTWVKLGAPAKKGDTTISLNEPVTGWRVGDRVFLTGTTRQIKREKTFRAERPRQYAD